MDKNPDQKQTQKHQDDLPRLVQRKSSSTIHCDICFELYHIMGRWPMLACPNQHFFCDQCIQGMFKLSHNEPVPCPICRTLIRISLVKPHYEMFRMINKEKTVKNALKEQQNQLFLYAFQKEIFEVAAAFKSGKSNTISKFRKLDLSSRKISQFQHLKSFPSLVYLKADQNLIQSPKNLDELKNICFLNLNNNFIKNLQPLQQLKGLSYLAIQNNQIEEIPSLLPFSKLSHWFLFGNPLKHIVADQLMLVQFKNLSIFSFSVKNPQSSKAYNNFLNRIGELQTMPKLYRIFLQNQQNETKKEKLVRKPKNNIQIVWIQSKNLKAAKEHNNWVNNFMDETFQYGQVFHFKVDPQNPFIEDYNVMSDKIIKKNDKFTILNSLYCINKKGKVNFKFKMMTPNPNILLGLCGAYVKHNASIYSQHFVGLTFWGSIYVRGSCTTIAAKLRIEDKPVVRLSVDFQLMEIKWFCDDMLIGAVDFPQQLKYSSLYFLLGVRDSQTEIGLLKD